MFFENLLKVGERGGGFFNEDRTDRRIFPALGKAVADGIEAIQGNTNRSIAEFLIRCAPGSGGVKSFV